MRAWIGTLVVALLAVLASNRIAKAVAIPILDPGFDIYNANTLTLAPDDRFPNTSAAGAGTGPHEDVALLNFDTFAPAGTGDIPAGWTAIGQRPSGANNTGRLRCDECFLSDSGTVALINSFGADEYEDPNNPGEFIQTPGSFFQDLTGVSVQPNTLYTATIEVSDLDITGRGPFQPGDDNLILGDPGMPGDATNTSRIRLNLSVGEENLGGTLEFTPITPGGFGTPEARISGGKELLTLTVLTGESVPEGDLTISFTAGGVFGTMPGTFGESAQTYFDNVSLDATPFSIGLTGDYNSDNKVDAADYVLWRRDNISGEQGYIDWQGNFGEMQGTGSSAAVGGFAVPEPPALIALLTGVLFALARLRPAGRSDVTAAADRVT
jgi:hypothetical protein